MLALKGDLFPHYSEASFTAALAQPRAHRAQRRPRRRAQALLVRSLTGEQPRGQWSSLANAPAASHRACSAAWCSSSSRRRCSRPTPPFFYFGFAQIALLLVPLFLAASGALRVARQRAARRAGSARSPRRSAASALAAWINATFVASPGGALDGRSLLVPLDERRDALQRAALRRPRARRRRARGLAPPARAAGSSARCFWCSQRMTVWIAASDAHAVARRPATPGG